MYMTLVYKNIQPGDEARALGEHPKVSALAWGHLVDDRAALQDEVTRLRAENAALQARVQEMEHLDVNTPA